MTPSHRLVYKPRLPPSLVYHHAEPTRRRAIFWNKVCKENGSPQTRWVYEIRKKTRNDYRRILRWVLRNQEKLRAEMMFESLQIGQQRNFWTEVQRMKRKHNPTIQDVDGVTEQDNIRDLFCEKYKELYNCVVCVAYDETEMKDLLSELNIQVSNCYENGKCNDDHNVSVNHMRDAIKQLKASKMRNMVGVLENRLLK
ncbi:hypothetical protein CAPTEDRAFT_189280 [Capitella teleta]|uniref:Uncharacterized protein n=1 Tax=Capitella teleta TaxID=283909 RepID=R7UTE1_CAPTE|nr:hypothetical protein CAPTEDRAFT_189280 [Capitella teleta]|eukprot:ELU06646.1 hypothetical protein CAPTEDRAFT_189280 [Capitella teleta]